MSKLNTLRDGLDQINLRLFSLLKKRKNTVSLIHQLKKEATLESYDLKREKELFTSYQKELQDFTRNELFIFSLMIEEHVRQTNPSYPCWSSQVHLEHKTDDFVDGTNPLLLAIFHKDSYDSLNIKNEFQVQI